LVAVLMNFIFPEAVPAAFGVNCSVA